MSRHPRDARRSGCRRGLPPALRTTVPRVLLLLGIVGLVGFAVPSVADEAPRDPLAAPVRDALHLTRGWHALQLRLGGARVAAAPAATLQQAHNDCALAIVTRLHADARRSPPPRDVLARTLALTPRGVTLTHLATGLTTLGWPATVQRARIDARASALHPPAIALLEPGHYVLVARRTATHVEYFDPLVGQVSRPLAAFVAQWTGKSVQLSTPDR